MTKILSMTLLLSITAMGCSKVNDTASVDDATTITFETQASKATTSSIDTMKGDADGFVVYGVELDDTDWYDGLDGGRYIYDQTAQQWGWESAEAPTWPVPFTQMNFYAYYPASAEGFSVSDTAPSSVVGDIVVQQSILDQTDYLACNSGDIVAKPMTGKLPLSFDHIMAKVSFSVVQEEGILTVIRQLGIENIINSGSYDYMNSQWGGLSSSNIGSFDDYVGSAGPFSRYGVEELVYPIRIDGHQLMLIPQSGGDGDGETPLWGGSITTDGSGEFTPAEAYISIRYRLNSATRDLVGYAHRTSYDGETEYDDDDYFYSTYKIGGSYEGPLYVQAGFRLTAQQLNWESGYEYDYTLLLNQTGGVYLSEYYHDVDGRNTMIRIDGSPQLGDQVYTTDVTIGISVNGWNSFDGDLYPN